MSNVFFISDLHLGHKRILEFSPMRGGSTIDEHDEWIVQQWNSVVGPKDLTWVHGDVCFDINKLHFLSRMNGRKNLILGNHDQKIGFRLYEPYFEHIGWFQKKYDCWLSHAPIHPSELRGLVNVHGHCHDRRIKGLDYVNVCVERLDGKPLPLDAIRDLQMFRNETAKPRALNMED